MAEKNKDKTNVMRLLGQKKIPYKEYTYECDAALSGVEVAKSLGQDEKKVFKTLVTIGKSKKNYVFVIPCGRRTGFEESGTGSKGKVGRDAENERIAATYRLCAWRVFADRNEEILSDNHS